MATAGPPAAAPSTPRVLTRSQAASPSAVYYSPVGGGADVDVAGASLSQLHALPWQLETPPAAVISNDSSPLSGLVAEPPVPKRGPGRPRKHPLRTGAEQAPAVPKRPRGRPRKSPVVPDGPPAVPKRRGRPPARDPLEGMTPEQIASAAPPPLRMVAGYKRPRDGSIPLPLLRQAFHRFEALQVQQGPPRPPYTPRPPSPVTPHIQHALMVPGGIVPATMAPPIISRAPAFQSPVMVPQAMPSSQHVLVHPQTAPLPVQNAAAAAPPRTDGAVPIVPRRRVTYKDKKKELEQKRWFIRWWWREKRAREHTHSERMERERRLKRWIKFGTELPEHMWREPAEKPEVERPVPEIAENVEKRLVTKFNGQCKCVSCYRQRTAKIPVVYHCRVIACKAKFGDDFLALLEHQLTHHGVVTAYCRRLRQQLFRQERGTVPYPPQTVFVGVQFQSPWEPPKLWTVEEIEHEHKTLRDRLMARRIDRPVIWSMFRAAYNRVKMYGMPEIMQQHRVALEHYESALVIPLGARNRAETVATVGLGRNWLLGAEKENAEQAHFLKVKAANADVDSDDGEYDDESDEEETVLLQVGEQRIFAREQELDVTVDKPTAISVDEETR